MENSDQNRFLLYIDILGFSDLTESDPRKVERIFETIDALNAHQHGNFTTIAFSDTVLVYNREQPSDDNRRRYLVWLLLEFAEDLHHRLTGQNVFFRALVVHGKFRHRELTNIDSFHGEALISAYRKEKEIPCIGLFIDDHCNKFNQYFRTTHFSNGISFVFVNRHLEYLNESTGGSYPSDDFTASDTAQHLPWQVRFLEDVHKNMRAHQDPRVRSKFLANWDLHLRRYPEMLSLLASHNFDLSCLAIPGAWRDEVSAMEADIAAFGQRV